MIEQDILSLLSDGRFHSGQMIARQLNISRTAVWKQITKLKELGAEIYSIRGKGYRIPGGLDLLDEAFLRDNLSQVLGSDDNLFLFTNIASTNQFLLSLDTAPKPRVCLAEYQSTGRGRLGRCWHSPFARNIYLSIRQALPLAVDALSGLSLAVGCCVAECLREQGASEVILKWPNDLKVGQQKLGGILIEVAGQSANGAELVIGVGLNWNMPTTDKIDQPWTNLKPLVRTGINRSQLTVSLIKHILNGLTQFSQSGFIAFAERWCELDGFIGKNVRLTAGNRSITGQYLGVDPAGALRIRTADGIEVCYGGELSLRELA